MPRQGIHFQEHGVWNLCLSFAGEQVIAEPASRLQLSPVRDLPQDRGPQSHQAGKCIPRNPPPPLLLTAHYLFVSQGLKELYDFQQANPNFDLDSVLAEQTKFYREYIQRGLRSIREGRPAPKTEYEEQVEELDKIRQSATRTFGLSIEVGVP